MNRFASSTTNRRAAERADLIQIYAYSQEFDSNYSYYSFDRDCGAIYSDHILFYFFSCSYRPLDIPGPVFTHVVLRMDGNGVVTPFDLLSSSSSSSPSSGRERTGR